MSELTPKAAISISTSKSNFSDVGDAPRSGAAVKVWEWIKSAFPSIAVILALSGVAVWGHSTDWTFVGRTSAVEESAREAQAWCQDHNVPEAECIECRPDLLPRGMEYGWCKVHGVAECPLEHADVAQLDSTESVLINRAAAERALALLPRKENNLRCLLHTKRIQFASVAAMEKLGIDIAIAVQRPVVEAITTNGEIVYNETLRAHLGSRVPGTIWRVEKEVGDAVKKGGVLALVESADVGRAKAEFLEAIAKVRVTKITAEKLRLLSGASVAARQAREADAAAEEASIRLLSAQQALVNLGFQINYEDFGDLPTDEIAKRIQFLGLPPETVAKVREQFATSNLYPLCSSLDGVVISRNAVAGQVVDPSTSLFGVADVMQMWLVLDVRQDDAKHLAIGKTVIFRPSDSRSEPEVKGELKWISTEADDDTRTVKARVNLSNADGRLRANTFGSGRIILREEPSAMVVPTEAIHWDGCCHIVFIRDKNFMQPKSPKFFHVRKVRLGVSDADTTEVIAGVLPGEVIASKNSVVLEAQLLKSNLGAGCCEVEPAKK